MKLSDISIGNYIFQDGKIIQVDLSILEDINKNPIKYNGISLSEEILLNLGFSKNYINGYIGVDKTNFVMKYPRTIDLNQSNFAIEYRSVGRSKYVVLNYVHQVQNFFRLIENKELILNVEDEIII